MDYLIVVLAWTVATVFMLAAIGKLAGVGGRLDALIALGEALLAFLVVSGASPLVASVLVTATAVAYCVYAFVRRSADECTCFGRRLPTSSPRVQRVRNTVLAGVSIVYVVLVWTSGYPGALTMSVVSPGLGLLSGSVLVIAPWLVEWTFAT